MPRSGQTGLDLPLAIPARALWLALALVLAVLFITDLRAPLGALDSIPYVLAVVLSLALPRGYEPVVVAASCTAITLISLFFAPEEACSSRPDVPPYRSANLRRVGHGMARPAISTRRAGGASRRRTDPAGGAGGGIRHVRLRPARRRQPLVARRTAHRRTRRRAHGDIRSARSRSSTRTTSTACLRGCGPAKTRVDPVNSRTSIASCDPTAPFGGCSSRAGRSSPARVRSGMPSTSRAWSSM